MKIEKYMHVSGSTLGLQALQIEPHTCLWAIKLDHLKVLIRKNTVFGMTTTLYKFYHNQYTLLLHRKEGRNHSINENWCIQISTTTITVT